MSRQGSTFRGSYSVISLIEFALNLTLAKAFGELSDVMQLRLVRRSDADAAALRGDIWQCDASEFLETLFLGIVHLLVPAMEVYGSRDAFLEEMTVFPGDTAVRP